MTADTTRRAILTLIPPLSGNPTDTELLTSFIEQLDVGAFETIVRRHGPMVLGTCRRVLRHRQDAEDAFQATFLVLARKASSITPRAAIANWLYGVARKAALKARERITRRRTREVADNGMTEVAIRERDGPDEELRGLLDLELTRLPDRYRSAIILCDLEGLTRKEAARQLGCPEGSVSSRLARARDLLARRLTRRGVALTSGLGGAILAPEPVFGLSSGQIASTVKAAMQQTVRHPGIEASISERVRFLTEGVLRMETISRRKALAVVLIALAMVSVSTYGFVGGTEPPPASKQTEQPSGAAPTAPKANTSIEGVWALRTAKVNNEENGSTAEIEIDDGNAYLVMITKDYLIWKGGIHYERGFTYKIESDKSPGSIDMIVLDEGPNKGKLVHGIYAVKGDELTICEAAIGKERPTQFSVTGQGSGKALYTFERQREIGNPSTGILGRWSLVSCRENSIGIGVKDGKEQRTAVWNQDMTAQVGKISLVINRTSFTMTRKKKREDNLYEGKITFTDPDFRGIDLHMEDKTVWKAIYSVKGDTLILAYGNERPMTFSTKDGLSTRVLVFVRENEEEK